MASAVSAADAESIFWATCSSHADPRRPPTAMGFLAVQRWVARQIAQNRTAWLVG